jgi:hypothetical protein
VFCVPVVLLGWRCSMCQLLLLQLQFLLLPAVLSHRAAGVQDVQALLICCSCEHNGRCTQMP